MAIDFFIRVDDDATGKKLDARGNDYGGGDERLTEIVRMQGPIILPTPQKILVAEGAAASDVVLLTPTSLFRITLCSIELVISPDVNQPIDLDIGFHATVTPIGVGNVMGGHFDPGYYPKGNGTFMGRGATNDKLLLTHSAIAGPGTQTLEINLLWYEMDVDDSTEAP